MRDVGVSSGLERTRRRAPRLGRVLLVGHRQARLPGEVGLHWSSTSSQSPRLKKRRWGVDTASRTQLAGCEIFHAAHNHWHFEDYAQFQLKDAAGTTVVQGTKTSFCLGDNVHSTPGLPGSPSTAYYRTCDQVTPQGISA